jgi:hypothetical protein
MLCDYHELIDLGKSDTDELQARQTRTGISSSMAFDGVLR